MSSSPIPSSHIPSDTTTVGNRMPPSNTPFSSVPGEHLPEFLREFNRLFSPGTTFDTVGDLRTTVASYGQKYNVVMSTKNSNYRSIHLWCKHAGVYRKSSKHPISKTVKSRKKETQRTDCKCFIKAKKIEQKWHIERSHGDHNHVIPTNCTVYSLHRRQSEPVKELILQLLNNGQKISSILAYLHMMGIHNIIKKDIENLQQHFRRKKLKEEQEKSVFVATSIPHTNTNIMTPSSSSVVPMHTSVEPMTTLMSPSQTSSLPAAMPTNNTNLIAPPSSLMESEADILMVPTPTHKLFTDDVLAGLQPDNTQTCMIHHTNTPSSAAEALIPHKMLPYTNSHPPTSSSVHGKIAFESKQIN
ncbi:hypothetical protein BD560DRAFT_489219 [Blakeslea trispora]|nr:hypothetical protein BD560DRAFT_489219 [Blakeslea trispora]